ncbi:50S ribosomal protein L29 [Candidatus Peregrinibacteria bacterium]|nr:50S ribosomal protein L29 [Candidatus Peregrinibacteria bacterium]
MVSTDELQKMTEKELEEELRKSGLDLLKLRLGVASRQTKETSKLKLLRKYIARIKTLKRMLKIEQIKENPTSAVTK